MSATVLPAACLVVIALLTGGSVALRTASRLWMRHRVERRARGWALLDEYLERPERLLAGAATGASAAAFMLGATLAVAGGSPWGIALAVLGWGLGVALLGDVVPRAVAKRWATALVAALIPVLAVAAVVTRPAVRLGERLARRGRGGVGRAPATPADDVAAVLREGSLEGVGEAEELAIISGVVAFGGKRVRDVMTPREAIFSVDAALPPRDLAGRVARQGWSRVPVVRGSLDDVIGLVLAKDVLASGGERMPRVRPVAVVPPDQPCRELLSAMLRQGRQLAVVRDAGGPVVGLVTLEDLLEELVGEIRDEHDEPVAPTRGGAAT